MLEIILAWLKTNTLKMLSVFFYPFKWVLLQWKKYGERKFWRKTLAFYPETAISELVDKRISTEAHQVLSKFWYNDVQLVIVFGLFTAPMYNFIALQTVDGMRVVESCYDNDLKFLEELYLKNILDRRKDSFSTVPCWVYILNLHKHSLEIDHEGLVKRERKAK